ncbi:MAG TPA: DUF2085 domain-containing protein [Thermomicrobiales bacterium]|nr:DUF2085 domain-containing protein [Thermomicrobiales bacterium]
MLTDRLEQRPAAPPATFPVAARWPAWLFLGLVGASFVALLAAPWPLPMKLHAVLHGLCAQRPSHSYGLGPDRLPFDARMAGIYGGFLLTAVALLARGRWRAARPPAWPLSAALGLGVALMGADGVNSTLQDFGLPYLYSPQNWLRLATGLLCGTALAVGLLYVLNTTLWTSVKDAPALGGWGELGVLLALDGLFALVVASGWGVLYAPVGLWLVLGAAGATFALVLAMVVLLRGRENRCASLADLAGYACVALVLAYAALAFLGGGRFLLERALGIPLGM